MSQGLFQHADPPYLAGLNEAQRAAVLATEGPVLVLAGAGTGKTRVLTTRLAHILVTGKARPGELLAVTFTNKAANEMKGRISAILGRPVEGWWLGTFHALAARMLRLDAEKVGLKPNFTILDSDDQLRLLKQLLEAEGIDDKAWPARLLLSVIERWKDRGLTPDRVTAGEAGDLAGGRLLELYRLYQARLQALNACDFGDLLLHCLELFRTQPDVLERYQQRFKYLLVDEYQDTNVAQYLWLRLLAQGHRNLCCVGDDDQCLAEGTLVTMADGSKKPIEAVREGDDVLSALGDGRFGRATVTEHRQRQAEDTLVRITTATGRHLTSTAEHVHFADVVASREDSRVLLFLRHRRIAGWGLELGNAGRVQRGESHDALWLIESFSNVSDAERRRSALSATYGLPQVGHDDPNPADGEPGADEGCAPRRDPGFAGAATLLAALDLDVASPHYEFERGFVMPRSYRVFQRALEKESLLQAGQGPFSSEQAPSRHAHIRDKSIEIHNAGPDGTLIATKYEVRGKAARLILRARLLNEPLRQRPAGSIRPGMAMVCEEGRYEEVVAVERVGEAVPVYDLNVRDTHNFIANGLVTHNSIYAWRGAEVGNILRFEEDFPGAQVIRLERNYRSTGYILAAASALIAKNEQRLGKTLWTEDEPGEKLRVRGLWDGEAEARFVGEEIEDLQRRGTRLSDIAILTRIGAQSREFEERFITLGLPYRVVGGLRFYERQEIRDALAYLRLVHSTEDDLAFERILNKPKRGLGEATVAALYRLARQRQLSLFAAARLIVETDELRPQARRALADFVAQIETWRREAAAETHVHLAERVLDESGYTAMLQADKSAEAPGRLENLKELVAALAEFDSLAGFLEHVSLVMERSADESQEQVTIMTLHGAKGLEFDTVFLPGWEDGLFPNQRALDENGLKGLEEERRLAYVGITRARKRAILSFAANRRLHGNWQATLPSRFLGELPDEAVERESDQGLYGGAGGFAWAAGGLGTLSRGSGPGASGWDEGRLSPGFERARQRGHQASRLLDLTPVQVSAVGGYRAGERVFHQKFGYGSVTRVEGDRLTIAFDKAGEKKVVASFVVPADQAG